MGCNCGGSGSTSPNVVFRVTYPDGTKRVFTTAQEARTEVQVKGGTIRAVSAVAANR
jgi:hypothetical protein